MNNLEQFKDLLRHEVPLVDDIEILAKWTIPYSHIARALDEGRLATSLVELGRSAPCAYTDWLAALRMFVLMFGRDPKHQPALQATIYPNLECGGYDLLLFRRKDRQ